jgi:hypothetical protein
MTEAARQLLALVAPWLRDCQPFLLVRGSRGRRLTGGGLSLRGGASACLLAHPPPAHPKVGPEGCGKATALRHCAARLQRRGGVAVVDVHCSAATGAAQVIDKLVQVGAGAGRSERTSVMERKRLIGLTASSRLTAAAAPRPHPSRRCAASPSPPPPAACCDPRPAASSCCCATSTCQSGRRGLVGPGAGMPAAPAGTACARVLSLCLPSFSHFRCSPPSPPSTLSLCLPGLTSTPPCS